MSEVIQSKALINLLDRKGIITKQELLEEMKRVQASMVKDETIVKLFSIFHDSWRENEHKDDGHGMRGSELTKSMKGRYFDLPDDSFEILREACKYHTDGLPASDTTIAKCWDADRLDLPMVGIIPDPDRMRTAPGKGLARSEGEAFLKQFSEEKLKDPLIQKLSEMAEIRSTDDLPRGVSCQMEIVSNGDKTYSSQVDYPKGSLQNPMTQENRRRKFRRFTADMLGDSIQERVEETVFNIEAIKDVIEILTIVAPGN